MPSSYQEHTTILRVMALVAFLALSSGTYFIHYLTESSFKESFHTSASAARMAIQSHFQRELKYAFRLLDGVDSSTRFRRALRSVWELDAFHSEYTDELSDDWLSRVKSSQTVFNLRFIDIDGNELFKAKDRYWVSDDLLQNKKDRLYFQDALKANGPWSISKVELNEEFGEVQLPRLPVVRVSKKVVLNAELTGVLVVNIDVSAIIDQIQALGAPLPEIVNSSTGYYISPPEKAWGEQLNNSYANVRVDRAGLWSRFNESNSDLIEWDDKLFYVSDFDMYVPTGLHFAAAEPYKIIIGADPQRLLARNQEKYILLALYALLVASGAWAYLHLVRSERKLQKGLQEAVEQRSLAESAERAMDSFLSRMSHEIRTPMNITKGHLELILEEQGLSDAVRSNLHIIGRSTAHQLRIVNEILEFAKCSGGNVAVDVAPVDIASLISDLSEEFRVLAQEKGIGFINECALDSGKTVLGDEFKLKQCLYNLLSNAVKFTSKGSVTITVEESELFNEATVCVSDSGIGIAPEQLKSIFDPFVQADQSIAQRFGGTGLGLTITKHFIESMGGRIGVKSEHLVGTSFYITLPLATLVNCSRKLANPEIGATQVDRSTLRSAEIPADSKILVVEDVELNAKLVMRFFAKRGIDIDWAQNGADAVALSEKTNYDVILMDVKMPIMNGLDASKIISARKSKETEAPKIIGLSADVMPNSVANMIAAGMCDFVAKPIDFEELECKVAAQF